MFFHALKHKNSKKLDIYLLITKIYKNRKY